MPGMRKGKTRQEVEVKLAVDDVAAVRRALGEIGAYPGGRARAREENALVRSFRGWGKAHGQEWLCYEGRVFEHNVLFDLPGHPLRKRGALLRLRWRMPAPVAHDPDTAAQMTNSGATTPKTTARRTFALNARLRAKEVPPRWKQPPGDALLTYKGQVNARGGYKVADELETAIDDPKELTRILSAMGFQPSFRYEKFRTEFRIPGIPGLAVDLDETPIGNFVELEGSRKAIDQTAALLGRSRDGYLTGSYAALQREFCRREGRPFGDMLFRGRKR
jgi:adenylate cyclase class 2